MTGQFSFSFAGDDIEDNGQVFVSPAVQANGAAGDATVAVAAPTVSAFPVQGKPLLAPVLHDLDHMLSRLPSKIAYDILTVTMDDGNTLDIPRRELWDVRVQLMAEDDDPSESGLGQHDVKTGIYEGGFKSWESSLDLVKVLAAEKTIDVLNRGSCVVIEVRPIPQTMVSEAFSS